MLNARRHAENEKEIEKCGVWCIKLPASIRSFARVFPVFAPVFSPLFNTWQPLSSIDTRVMTFISHTLRLVTFLGKWLLIVVFYVPNFTTYCTCYLILATFLNVYNFYKYFFSAHLRSLLFSNVYLPKFHADKKINLTDFFITISTSFLRNIYVKKCSRF